MMCKMKCVSRHCKLSGYGSMIMCIHIIKPALEHYLKIKKVLNVFCGYGFDGIPHKVRDGP